MFHVEQPLLDYEEMLLRVNPRLNLISRQDVGAFRERHLQPCVDFARLEPVLMAKSIVDMGSGGGLPGIPVAILNTKARICLAESIQKKAEFLRRVVNKLKLQHVSVHADRIENLRSDASVDLVCARFLADAEQCARLAFPLQTGGGQLLLIKGHEEKPSKTLTGYSLLKVHTLSGQKVVWHYAKDS